MAKPLTVFTIGYEGRSPDDFIAALVAQKIDLVIDVRQLPLSRRRGFSKTALGEALAAAGIAYVHLRAAGNPFRAQRADIVTCLALYRDHLEASPDVLLAVIEAARGHRAALLCVEHDAQQCHRSVIASAIEAHVHARIENL